MNDAVFQLLFRCDTATTEKQIRQILDIHHHQEIEELRELLKSDDRFVGCCNSTWKCVPLSVLLENRPISEVAFVVTDIETTGSIKGRDRIIDIAALKVQNGIVLKEFESLVNPERKISKTISRLTKISNQTVENSPVIESVLPDFVEFMEDGVFVAHNAPFDFSFINAEVKRLGVPEIKNRIDICTFRLAQKLLPDVKARGISGLSLYFDYKIENRHRAMPDVKATSFFLDKFLKELEKREVNTLHQLIEFQKDRLSKKDLRKKISRQKKKRRLNSNKTRIPN